MLFMIVFSCGPTNKGDLRSDSEYVILTIQNINRLTVIGSTHKWVGERREEREKLNIKSEIWLVWWDVAKYREGMLAKWKYREWNLIRFLEMLNLLFLKTHLIWIKSICELWKDQITPHYEHVAITTL